MGGKYDINLDSLEDNTSHGILLRKIRPGSRVLECGCARGYMTRFMKEELHCQVCIVEYNEEDFQTAMAYAEDGFRGNLEENAWCEYYANQRFDAIMFADVLEHLRNPQEVLQRAAALLKDDGMVAASIPNVGHDDILINLMNNRWNYTPLGLLDDTHIHFWAQKNLDDLFESSGLRIVLRDYTILAAYYTEQRSQDSPEALLPAINQICRRPFGDVYQFILFAQKERYVSENQTACEDRYEQRHGSYGAIPQFCSDYQQRLEAERSEHHLLKVRNQEQSAQIEAMSRHSEEQQSTIDALTRHSEEQQSAIDALNAQLAAEHERYLSKCEEYDIISNAFFWKISAPARTLLDRIKRKA